MPRAAPRRCSASTARSDSLAKAIGTGRSSARVRRSPSGSSRQPRFGAIDTIPSLRRITPTTAVPAPTRVAVAGSRSRIVAASSASALAMSSTLERPRGRSIRRSSSGRPPSPTAAAASESTAISNASTIAPVESGRTTGEGLPGVPSRAAGLSLARSPATSSPMRPRIALRVNPVRVTRSERDIGPLSWSSRTMALRFARRTVSLRCPSSSRPLSKVCVPLSQMSVRDSYNHADMSRRRTTAQWVWSDDEQAADRHPVDGRHRDPEGHPGDAPGHPRRGRGRRVPGR